MRDGVWGNVKEWGLVDHSDDSAEVSTDPVCGREVEEAHAAGKVRYAGVDYYFCSRECQNDFDQTPGEYLGQPHRPPMEIVDINVAAPEVLRGILHVDDDGVNRILGNRPYHSWDEFKSKNPGFSDPMLRGLRRLGVIISTPDLHRLR